MFNWVRLLIPLLALLVVEGTPAGTPVRAASDGHGESRSAAVSPAILPAASVRPFPYRYHPRLEECVPYVRPPRGRWMISVDGFQPSGPRQVRHLAILSPVGSRLHRVTVVVVTPSGAAFRAKARVASNKFHYIRWPTDFRGAPKIQRGGVYTVIWIAGRHRLLVCNGFIVR